MDYYRAFEQRSAWARASLLVLGEVEEYEDRLPMSGTATRMSFSRGWKTTVLEDVLRQAGTESTTGRNLKPQKIDSRAFLRGDGALDPSWKLPHSRRQYSPTPESTGIPDSLTVSATYWRRHQRSDGISALSRSCNLFESVRFCRA
ncbi:ABC-three component system protein [Pseudomonas aeruginosa]